MSLSKLVRIVGLCLLLSITALTAFAEPPVQPCGCGYCTHAGQNRDCTIDGQTVSCQYFLAVALCTPTGG